jgi:hypothetical protein
MPLPEFNEFGDLPEGNHPASVVEVVACCSVSCSSSSWPFGGPSETADDVASWR